jgi:hypothetical protein
MESSSDTCAVAAAIVGLTEKLIPDLDSVAEKLRSNGWDRQNVGSAIRPLQEYGALLNLPASKPSYSAGTPTSKWWKRLFE